MNDKTYVCMGSCQAKISETEYKNGLIVCGNDTCENKGQSFIKGEKCTICGKNYAENQKHQH